MSRTFFGGSDYFIENFQVKKNKTKMNILPQIFRFVLELELELEFQLGLGLGLVLE